jgi:hypothetical protein
MANAKTLIENLFMHLSPDCIFDVDPRFTASRAGGRSYPILAT